MEASASGTSKQQDDNDKDRLAPEPVNDDNRQYEDPDLSHEELKERLDMYSAITRSKEETDRYFDVERMKQKYLDEIRQRGENRTKGGIYYAQGLRSGLRHTPYEDIREMHEEQDRKLRNDVTRQAKEYYNDNDSLKRFFDREKDRDR